MEFKKVKITPEVALEMLENNNVNRTFKRERIQEYSRQLEKGIWKSENGELIKFSKSGRLLDGQHRLAAIVKTGITIDLYCAYGLDEDVFEFIDVGLSRHAGHVLQIAGIKNSNNVGKIIKNYTLLQKNIYGGDWSGNSKLSNHEVLEIYRKDEEMYINAHKKASLLYKSFNKVITLANIGAYYLYLKEHNPDKVDLFFDKLCTGIHIVDNRDPINQLRNKLISFKLDKDRRLTPKYFYIYLIKAWNLYIKDKKISLLRFQDNEEIPLPLSK